MQSEVQINDIPEGFAAFSQAMAAMWATEQRRGLESVTVFSDARSFSGASAATVSYSQDREDNESWSTLKGVVMRPIRNEQRQNLVFSPSIAFYRVRYFKDSSSTTDTLVLRFSTDRLYPQPGGRVITSWTARANPAFTTDSRFDARIVSVEFAL